MTDFFWNTVTDDMHFVLNGFAKSEAGKYFYLAGGTALSLQLGHRLSVDLDFFSPTEDIPSIRTKLEETLKPFQAVLADSSWGNLVFLAKGVRVGFYGYGFPLIEPLVQIENVKLASIPDIALMKLDAMLARAARKDFYDLYFIGQNIPLRKLLDEAPRKYSAVRDFEVQATKRLTFFENAERETDPILLRNVSWQVVKQYFIQQAKEIEQSWLK